MHDFLPQSQRFLGVDDAWADPERAAFVVLPVAFERTSSYGKGSQYGPAAILEASQQVELFDMSLGREAYRSCGGIATLAPLTFESDDAQAVNDRLCETVAYWLSRKKIVITLGGEHTGIVGAVRAHAQFHDDLTVLQFDAHADLRGEYENSPWNHACAAARILDFHSRLVQIGIRSQAAEESEIARRLKIPVFPGEAVPTEGTPEFDSWLDTLLAVTSDNVYITFDCDVLDPSIIPATGTPEPGGLSWRQLNLILSSFAVHRRIVGFDVCELAPIADLNHPQFTIAKLIYRLIGWLSGRK